MLLRRLLAHTLVEALWDQLLLDVSGGGGVFTLGDTSRLIGTTVAAAVSGTGSADTGRRDRFVGCLVSGFGWFPLWLRLVSRFTWEAMWCTQEQQPSPAG